MNPSKSLIRWITPLVWRIFPARKIQAIREFSEIERDSGCQLLRAIDSAESPELKAYLFQHVLEEFFHADIFDDVRKRLSDQPISRTTKSRHQLLNGNADLDSVLRFISYVQVGESAVHRDFKEYSNLPIHRSVQAVFARAGRDEGKHETDTHDLVIRLSGSSEKAQLYLREAARSRIWRRLIDTLNGVGSFFLAVNLVGIYYIFGWLGRPSSRKRLVLNRNAQLGLLRSQVDGFAEHLR